MLTFTTVADIQAHLQSLRAAGKTIGFVPTMGALHAGHLSLLDYARRDNTTTVCSIFVNPTQFNDASDLEKYPRTVATDTEMLIADGCDILFLPAVSEVYPQGIAWENPFEFGDLVKVMEGAHRPGHFEGMVQVVKRLLEIVAPDALYMGQKDFQQQRIVASMLEQQHSRTRLVRCPILREPDGLAMSSRNVRLSSEERAVAPHIYRSLQQAVSDKAHITPTELKAQIHAQIEAASPLFAVDYVDIVAADTLLPLSSWQGQEAVICVAVRLGAIRLIDNILI